MKKIIILAIITLLCACDLPSYWGIRLENISNEQVAMTYGVHKVGKRKWMISTSFPKDEFYTMVPPSVITYLDLPFGNKVTNDSAGDSIAIFVIADSIINNYNWEEIREKKLYKKYSSLLGDLRMNKQKSGSHFIYSGEK